MSTSSGTRRHLRHRSHCTHRSDADSTSGGTGAARTSASLSRLLAAFAAARALAVAVSTTSAAAVVVLVAPPLLAAAELELLDRERRAFVPCDPGPAATPALPPPAPSPARSPAPVWLPADPARVLADEARVWREAKGGDCTEASDARRRELALPRRPVLPEGGAVRDPACVGPDPLLVSLLGDSTGAAGVSWYVSAPPSPPWPPGGTPGACNGAVDAERSALAAATSLSDGWRGAQVGHASCAAAEAPSDPASDPCDNISSLAISRPTLFWRGPGDAPETRSMSW